MCLLIVDISVRLRFLFSFVLMCLCVKMLARWIFMASFFFSWNVLKLFHYTRWIRVECKKCKGRGTCESDDNLYVVYKLVWWVFVISSLIHLRSFCFVFSRVELLGNEKWDVFTRTLREGWIQNVVNTILYIEILSCLWTWSEFYLEPFFLSRLPKQWDGN